MFKKKKLIMLIVIIAVLFSACGKKNADEQQNTDNGDEIVLSTDNQEDPDDDNADDKNDDTEDEDDDEEDVLQKPQEENRIDVRAVVVGDCTGIGFAPIMGWGANDKNHEKYSLTVAADVDEAAQTLTSGNADVAILPLSKALDMYKADDGIVVLATNTLNNIYIADTTGSVTEGSQLSGKTVTIYDDGKLTGSVEKMIAEHFGAQVTTVDSNDAVVSGLADGSIQIAILPEPYITLAKLKNDAVEMGPDVADLWAEIDNSKIISSVLVARKDFVESNKDSMIYILDDFRQSVSTVEHAVTKTLEWTTTYNIMTDRSLAISTMRNCNYTFMQNYEMIVEVENFLRTNKDVVGDIPGEDFYYEEGK